MGPTHIAVDEITAAEDCKALMQAGWCGVKLLATAHASDVQDFYCRPIYGRLAEAGIFDTLIVMRPDKTWRMERIRK
jgi:stage III sporulation protein AA